MTTDDLIHYPWIPVVLWLVLYTSDYYLTLWGARLAKLQTCYQYTGSYELTPEYQSDVDNLRKVSPTFIIWLITGAVALLISGWFAKELPLAVSVFTGYLLFPEFAIHVRHLTNICTYRRMLNPAASGVSGNIRISAQASYGMSAVELLAIGMYTLTAFALTKSALLLGGGVGILSCAYSHWKLARRYQESVTEAPDTTTRTDEPSEP